MPHLLQHPLQHGPRLKSPGLETYAASNAPVASRTLGIVPDTFRRLHTTVWSRHVRPSAAQSPRGAGTGQAQLHVIPILDPSRVASPSRRSKNPAGPAPISGPGPLLLTVPQAASVLAMGTTSAWALVWSGELPSVRRGRRWVRVPYQSCIDWVERNRNDRGRTEKQQQMGRTNDDVA
jgi:hypothetical protein